MTRHILITFATNGIDDNALDLRKEAASFSSSAREVFDDVFVFDPTKIRYIYRNFLGGLGDPLCDQTDALDKYLRENNIPPLQFKCHRGWLRANCMLFKPLITWYVLKYLANVGDIVTWHDCNVTKNPHYMQNLSLDGRRYLEERILGSSVSMYSDTLLRPAYDIKNLLMMQINRLWLSKYLPTLKVFVFSIRKDDIGEQYVKQWLDLTACDGLRNPFPDTFPQPWYFRHHSPEQATAYLAFCILGETRSAIGRMNHTFLWNSTYLPPRPTYLLNNLHRRSCIRRNLALARLLTNYPRRWSAHMARLSSQFQP